jgi:hypothetical protein
MDRATVSFKNRSAQAVVILLGLSTCGVDLGCGRTGAFLRDEPPLLGTTATATAKSRTDKDKDKDQVKGPTTRPAGGSDLYARSFGRTQPRPVPTDPPPSAADAPKPPEGDTQPAADDPARTPQGEPSVQPTALRTSHAAGAGPGPAPGIELKAPVPLRTVPDLARAPAAVSAPPRRDESGEPSPPAPAPTPESLVSAARERVEAIQSYQVDIHRQERVGEALLEPEDIILSLRRQPRAVRLQWPKPSFQGREVIYAERETRGLIEVHTPNTLIPIPRIALPPDSPLALRNSRHPITEAGFETILGNLSRTIEENKAGNKEHGTISYGGLAQPEGLDTPCHKVVRVLATGEIWQVYFDPESKFPALVQANAPNGDLLERYLFRAVRPDPAELAAADAFDPDRRWGESKGLLGRLARRPGAPATAEAAGPAQ